MMQDVVPPQRRRPTPKYIEPLEKTDTPEPPEPVETDEPVFKTPEEAATEEIDSQPATPAEVETEAPVSHKRHRIWTPHGRKQWIITAAVAVVVLGGGGAGWMLTHDKKPAPTPVKAAVMKPAPTTPIYSDLSGLPITDPSLNKKPVTAVMIENSTDARPQSGLSQAGVVFEAQAEGGVTRFMALYQDTAPSSIGPVRSARPYYVQWALGFNAAYVHAGGSPDALSDIPNWHVQDINLLDYGSPYANRISSRIAPHNLYSSVPSLSNLESSKHYTSSFTGFPRAKSQTPMAQPTASTINLSVSGPVYNPQYIYDASTNSYNRSTDGTPDTDASTGKQISPTVVIAIVVPLSQGALDSSGAYYSDYNVLGSGTAYVFQNGGVTLGQWHKSSNTNQITFTDSNGTAIPLNRGQTWITAVSASNQVSYKGTQTTKTQ